MPVRVQQRLSPLIRALVLPIPEREILQAHQLPTWLHYFSGTAEILGGLGLILPRLIGVQQRLLPVAGAGLAALMVAAAVWHLSRGEAQNVVFNLVLSGLSLFVAVAYARGPLRALRSTAARP